MSERPIAYVMEQTLGSVTHYLSLREHEDVAHKDSLVWLPVEYSSGKLPWTIRGGLGARRALKPVLPDVDGVFIHTTTLAPLVADLLTKVPTVLSSDGTPLNKVSMRQAYGLEPEGAFARWGKRSLYRQLFSRAAGFVAWSAWTKQSFVEDYGCKESDVAVIPPGIDLRLFDFGERHNELPRILFVGGDFARKGGDLLLDVFRQRLRGRAELRLVTKTPVPEEPGVRVFGDISANSPELRNLYAESDIFALPTRADCYPLVCMEALAAGLPMVAARTGGIPDMVIEGKTGHLVNVDDAKSLGDKLEALVADTARRQAMSLECREEAVRRFEIRENARRLFEFVRSRC